MSLDALMIADDVGVMCAAPYERWGLLDRDETPTDFEGRIDDPISYLDVSDI